METARRVEAFRLLGIPVGSDRTTVARAYRQLALATHPDVTTDPRAAERFTNLTEAYRVAAQPAPTATHQASPPPATASSAPLSAGTPAACPSSSAKGTHDLRHHLAAGGLWFGPAMGELAEGFPAPPRPPIVAGPVMIRPLNTQPSRDA